jgi:hypothetical protein
VRPKVGIRGRDRAYGLVALDDPKCFLSSALLLHRLRVLATRAVEDVNLGHVFKIEAAYQTHHTVAVTARWRVSEGGHGQVGNQPKGVRRIATVLTDV